MSVRGAGSSMRGPARALGCTAIAAVIAVDPAGWSPFGPAKWWAMSTLGFGAAGWAWWRGGQRPDRWSAIAWSVLLIWLGLASVLGGDVPTALLGHPDRHLGLITYGLFALVFRAGQHVSRPDDRRCVSRCFVVACLALGAYACWELAWGPPIDVTSTTDRLMGPFGSAAFVGAASTLLVPAAIGMALDRSAARRWRAAAAMSAITGTLALVGSGTRGALIGAAITAVVVIAVRRPSLRIVLTVAVAVAATLALVAPWLGDVLERAGGAGSRIDEWRVAVRVITANPVLGVGPEGYRIAVADGVDRDYERAHSRDVVQPDRAHSAPLDLALAGGLPAATLYLALMVLVGWRVIRLLRRGGDPTMLGLAAGVLAYGLQQLVLFPVAELDTVWWCAAGVMFTLDLRPAGSRPLRIDPVGSDLSDSGPPGGDRVGGDRAGDVEIAGVAVDRRGLRDAVAVLSLTFAAVAFVAGMFDAAADRLARDALTDSALHRCVEAIGAADRAVDLRPDVVRYRLVAANVHLTAGSLADVDAAIDQLQSAQRWSANDPLVAEWMGRALLQRAQITGTEVDVQAALTHWQAEVGGDPHRASWQLELGRAAALAGDLDTARAAWIAAADLDPRSTTATDLLVALDRAQS